ncbi:Zn-ribbon domain-containing OB-fold protein [Thermogutta sp.]|jgi:uncharacterized OB-fold protein|uniref:Zn-ribbon domain-containing OB-fold protein n=1 Tax=Thermogutta sp. TaxID=1962930 RepID=UPI00321F689B
MTEIEKFGYFPFIKHSGISNYVTYLEQGKIMATKCEKCGTVYFPPRKFCPTCLTSDMKWIEYDQADKGELTSFSTLYLVPAGFDEKEIPVTVGVAQFPDGNRVYARVEGVDPQSVKVGMRVKLVPKKLAEDRVTHVLQPI